MLRRLLAITSKEVRQLARDRVTFGMIIGIPTLQLLLFGFAINLDIRNLPAAVLDESNTWRSRELIAECVRRCDGVMLTGGDDIEPRLYRNGLPSALRRTVSASPDGGERDLRELILIDELFRQRKPLLAI